RIFRFAEGDESGAALLDGFHLRFGRIDADHAQRPPAAAAPDQFRQHGQRRLGAAEPVDQVAKGDGTDILRPDQAQPVAPLLPGEAGAGDRLAHPPPPIRGSVPEASRGLVAGWRRKTRMPSTAKAPATRCWPSTSSTSGTAATAVRAASDE